MAKKGPSIVQNSVTEGNLPTVSEGNLRLIMGIIGLFAVGWYLVEAFGMPLGELARPGPGLFPRVVGLAGVVISGIVIVESLTPSNKRRTIELPSKRERKVISLFLLAFLAYVLLLPFFGQYITATLYAISAVSILSSFRWYKSVAIGIAIGLGISVIFVGVFGISLPTAVWN